MIIEDLISNLEILQQQFKSVFDNYKNPLIGLITSDWYLSESFRLSGDVKLSWEECGKIDFISTMANKINDFDISTPANSSFEASFCSWYQPYHFIPRTKWGAHIRYRCWAMLSARLNKECPNLIDNHLDSVKAAFFYLYIHVLFHHLIENVTTKMEISHKAPLLYINYLSHIFTQVFNTNECIEESLANSYLYERSNLTHIERNYLKQELLSQGKGYNNFIDYIGPKFNDGLIRLNSQIMNGQSHSQTEIDQLSDITNVTDISNFDIIPVWIHQIPLRTY